MRNKKFIQVLYNLRFVKDDPKYHQEENVLSHSLQAYKIAKRESDNQELQMAALFHDCGKLIERNEHDKISIDILKSFGYYNYKVFWLIKNHMRIRGFLSGEMKKLSKIKELVNHPWFPELIHLRRCDASGRKRGKSIEFNWGEINNLIGETDVK